MIDMERNNLVLMMEAGYIYLGMQRFKEAKEVFEGVSVLAPDSDVPVVALGSLEFCRGELDKAIDLYKKALKKDENSLFAKAYMAEALFFLGKKEEAARLLVEVRDMVPDGGAGGFADALLNARDEGFTPGIPAKGKNKQENKNAKKKK